MNNNINRFFILLIILCSFILDLYSKELVITIPDEFSVARYPLPPFPEELVTTLEATNFEDDILESVELRDIQLTKIEYFYYNEFLKNSLTDKSIINHYYIISSDLENSYLGYSPKIMNNNFSISTEIGYDSSNTLIANGEYRDYRLPLSLTSGIDVNSREYLIKVGYSDYNTNWYISPTLGLEESSIKMYYSGKKGLKPYIDLNLRTLDDNYALLGLGTKNFRMGVSNIDLNLLPYIYSEYFNSQYGFRFNTAIENSLFDYNLKFFYRKKEHISFGLGSVIDKKYNMTPYILASESLFLGERVYKISQDELTIKSSFINDDFAAIILIKINKYNTYEIALDLDFNNFGISSFLEYEKNTSYLSLGLILNYKADKL